MKLLQITLSSLALLGLTACATPDVVTRAIDPSTGFLTDETTPVPAPSYNVTAVNVVVPTTFTVSEANSYKPRADIVWRGDPMGNRYDQVATLMQNAISAGVAGMDGTRDVILNIQVERFHALTEKARYTVGGTHDIRFMLSVVDVETGVVLDGPRLVVSELAALGGRTAIQAEANGQTQKVRISAFLRQLIQTELATPHVAAPYVASAE